MRIRWYITSYRLIDLQKPVCQTFTKQTLLLDYLLTEGLLIREMNL